MAALLAALLLGGPGRGRHGAGDRRRPRPARQHRPGSDLDPAVQLPGPDHRRLPAAHTRRSRRRRRRPTCARVVRDAAAHRLPAVRELRRHLGLERRRVPQGLSERYGLRAVADHGALDPATFDAAARPGQGARARSTSAPAAGRPRRNMNTLENALDDRAGPQRARQARRRARPEGLRPQPRRRVPHQARRTTSTATALTEMVPGHRGRDAQHRPALRDVRDRRPLGAARGSATSSSATSCSSCGSTPAASRCCTSRAPAHDGAITDVGTPNDITDWESVFRAAARRRLLPLRVRLRARSGGVGGERLQVPQADPLLADRLGDLDRAFARDVAFDTQQHAVGTLHQERVAGEPLILEVRVPVSGLR